MRGGADIFAIWPGFVMCLRCLKLCSRSSSFGLGLRSFGWHPFYLRSGWLSVRSCFSLSRPLLLRPGGSRWSGLRSNRTMKAVKIIVAGLAALWALALVPKLVAGISHSDAPLAFSHIMGSVFGILIASAISIVLFQ